MAAETFLARLDRVPLNRFHWRLLIVAGLGWMFDAMDVILIAFLLTPIRTEFGLDATQTGFVASAGFVGMFLGAAVAGRLADRVGRKSVFQVTLVLFSVGFAPETIGNAEPLEVSMWYDIRLHTPRMLRLAIRMIGTAKLVRIR